MPTGWELSPHDLIDQINDRARDLANRPGPGFVAGMSPVERDGRYLLIQVLPMPPGGRPTYEQLERSLGLAVKDDPVKGLRDVIAGLKLGEASLDRSKNRFAVRIEMIGSSGKPLKGVSFGHLGATHMVMVNCYAPADAFDASLGLFEQISNSVSLDQDARFVPAVNTSIGTYVVSGALAGGLGGLIFDWRRRVNRKKSTGMTT